MREILIVHGGANVLRARAAALLVIKDFDRFQCIIFSGGKTAGPENPSEAQTMKCIFLQGVRILIPHTDLDQLKKYILLEEQSYDTETNALSVLKMLGNFPDIHCTILSSLTHLPRIQSIYSRLGFFDIDTISAEGIFFDTHVRHHQEYIIRIILSYAFCYSVCLEIILFGLSHSPVGRRWIRSKTILRIQNNPPSK